MRDINCILFVESVIEKAGFKTPFYNTKTPHQPIDFNSLMHLFQKPPISLFSFNNLFH